MGPPRDLHIKHRQPWPFNACLKASRLAPSSCALALWAQPFIHHQVASIHSGQALFALPVDLEQRSGVVL